MRLRDADAWGVARANRVAAEQEQATSESAKQQRRDLNRRLAEKLVAGWSAHEYREKVDGELAFALDGNHDGKFDVNAAKYTLPITVKSQSFGADVNAAAAATEQRTKQRLHSFHSTKWNGEKK